MVDAVRCAIEVQNGMVERNAGLPPERRIDIDGAVNACLNGLALGMFLSYMVAPYRKSGQLKYVLEKFETEPIPVQVVYAQGRPMSNRVRVFVDECVQKLRRAKFD